MEKWLTVEEIAEALNVEAATVRRWLRDGKMDGINLKSKAGWRIREEDYHAFIADQESWRSRFDRLLAAVMLRDDETRDQILKDARGAED